MTKAKEVKRRGVIAERVLKRPVYDSGREVRTVYDVTYSYPSGTDDSGATKWHKLRKRGCRSKAEAEKHLRSWEEQFAEGTLDTRQQGLEGTAVGYILDVIAMKQELGIVRAVTANNYRANIETHVAPRFGMRAVAEVTRDDVKAIIAEMTRQGRRASTVRQVFAILEGCFGEAVADGLIAVSPTYKVRLPKADKKRRREFDLEEVRRVLDAAVEPWAPIFTLLAITGLRRSEVLGLTWEDYDAEERVLRVRRGLHRVNGELVTEDPKSERSERDLDLDDAAVGLIESVRVSQAERMMALGVRPVPPTTPIFDNGLGEWRDPDSVSSAWAKLTKRCGVKGLRMHDLRHLVATSLIDEGYDAAVVADVMGHHSPSFTLDTYVRGRRDRRRAAAKTMSATLKVQER